MKTIEKKLDCVLPRKLVAEELMEKTEDLEKLKKGVPFTWGKVIGIHEIGDYSIVETLFYDRKEKVSIVEYFSYANGRSTGHAFPSLDEALVYAISYKYDGRNTKADQYFCKGIGITHD